MDLNVLHDERYHDPLRTEVGSYFVANYPPFSVWTKEAVASDGQRMLTAYEVSILGMLAMPFLLAGLLGFLLWRASRTRPAPGEATGGGPPG